MLFPEPLGPTSATVSPGSSSSSTSRSTIELARRVPERDPLEARSARARLSAPPAARPDGGSVRQVEHTLGDGGAVGTRVELRARGSGAADRARERARARSGPDSKPDAPFREPNPDGDGDERDPERRGELEDRTGDKARPATSPSSSRRYSSLTSAMVSACTRAAVEAAASAARARRRGSGSKAAQRLPALRVPPPFSGRRAT